MSKKTMENMVILCGGDDHEMREIKAVANTAGVETVDYGLSWGAKASDYSAEIKKIQEKIDLCAYRYRGGGHPRTEEDMELCKEASKQLVFIELEEDCELPGRYIVIDHHGKEAGKPPALEQVARLLGVETTKHQDMVGMMDAGYIYGLLSGGFNSKQIADFLGQPAGRTIRQMLIDADSSSLDDIAEAERAIATAERLDSGLIIVRCSHSNCGPINARLYGQQDQQNILILSVMKDGKEEANFYGSGEQVRALVKMFPQGWTGGAGLMPPTPEAVEFWSRHGGCAPDTAFFGSNGCNEEIEKFIRNL